MLNEIKVVLEENIDDALCGIFDCEGDELFADEKEMLFDNNGIQISICRSWGYFEILGLTDEEFDQIQEWYEENKWL